MPSAIGCAAYGEGYLLDGVVGDQAQDYDLFLLADTMHSVLGLQIHLRVPIGVEDDDCVCSLQVQTQSTGSCAEEKDIILTVRLVEQLHSLLTVFGFSRAIETEVAYPLILEVGLHDVHEMCHLRED